MPNFDQTGPNGQGPATGQKKGPCNSQKQNLSGNNFGKKRGCCQQRGNERRFFGQETQPLSLDEQEKLLEDRLANIRKAKESNSKK